MIAIAKEKKTNSVPAWHESFLALLPTIVRHARHTFRHLSSEAKQDAVQEVIANCLVAYVRLAERDKLDIVYPGVLARFAIKQYRAGRRVGTSQCAHDVYSQQARQRSGYTIHHIGRPGSKAHDWREQLVDSQRITPADRATFRVDFEAWLRSLDKRDRQIALELAKGERTKDVASRFGLTCGRISQLRGELRRGWDRFHHADRAATTSRPHVRSTPDLAAINRSLACVGDRL